MADRNESLFSRLTKLFRSGPIIKTKVKGYTQSTTSSSYDLFKRNISDHVDNINKAIAVGSGGNDRISDLVLDIEDVDVLQKSLFYNNEAYSWYHIKPSALLFGNSAGTPLIT